MFLAFLPSALSGFATNTAWRLSHAGFFVFHASVFAWYFQQARRFAFPLSTRGLIVVGVGLGVLLAEVSVALGFGLHAAPYLYLLALLWFLYLAASAFIALVFPQSQGNPPTA